MKSTKNVAPPGQAPMDTPPGAEAGKDPKYRNTERAQNFPTGVIGMAGSSAWSSDSTPDAQRGVQGTGSG